MIKLRDLLTEGDTIVKNKKTGNVYSVKAFNPAIHDKPTAADIQTAKAKNGGKIPTEKPAPTANIVNKPKDPTATPQNLQKLAQLKTLMPGIDTPKQNNDGGIMRKIKDFVGSKGFQFGARRPTEEEDKVAANHFSDYENKKVNSIGVDKVTGNIYAANDDYEVILSPKGKLLKLDMSITGKYNKDALDAYQGELEKDADKYYKRQAIKNKFKSLLGYKPDEFGDYRF